MEKQKYFFIVKEFKNGKIETKQFHNFKFAKNELIFNSEWQKLSAQEKSELKQYSLVAAYKLIDIFQGEELKEILENFNYTSDLDDCCCLDIDNSSEFGWENRANTIDQKFYECEYCHEYHAIDDDLHYIENEGIYVCNDCLSNRDNYSECADCGRWFNTNYGKASMVLFSEEEYKNGEALCLDCLVDRIKERKLDEGFIKTI